MANELTTTTVATTTDLAHANLARYARDAQGAFAPNTVRALRADTAVFTAWCHTAGAAALPAGSQTVADFIDAMRAASKRPTTIRRDVSSIAHLHRAAELPVPSDSNTVKLALRRMMKEDGASQKLRWSPFFGQAVKLSSPDEKDGPDDGQAEAVWG